MSEFGWGKPITAHELARQLLEMPDVYVLCMIGDGGTAFVKGVVDEPEEYHQVDQFEMIGDAERSEYIPKRGYLKVMGGPYKCVRIEEVNMEDEV